MELGYGYQCLPDTVQEIQRLTVEGPRVEIPFDVLRLPIPRGFRLHIYPHPVKGQNLRFSSGKFLIQIRELFGKKS